MAKISAFNKVKPPKTADEWLASYEELLKRNRGGASMMGYDTASNIPMRIPGKVANATGLEGYAGQPKDRVQGVQYLDEQQLLDQLLNIDPNTLDEEGQNNLEMLLDSFAGSQYEPTPAPTPEPSEDMIEPGVALPEVPQVSPVTKTPGLPRMNRPNTQVPEIMGPTAPNLPQATKPQQEVMGPPVPTQDELEINQLTNEGDETFNKINEIVNAPERDYVKNPATPEEISKFAGKDLQTINAANKGLTVEQTGNVELDNPTISFAEPAKTNPIRQFAGDTVSWLGDKLGKPETNWSERIAGGPTKDFNKAQAADNIEIVEPDPELEYRPGAGIDMLKGQSFAAGPFKKPELATVGGQSKMIGNIGGMADTASMAAVKSSATSSNKPVLAFDQQKSIPPISQPQRSASIPQSASVTRPMPASSSQPASPNRTVSPSPTVNKNLGYTNTATKQSVAYSAPKAPYVAPKAAPAPAPWTVNTKTQQSIAPKSTPIPTPVPTPAKPAPTPAPQSKPSVVTSVANAIKNLFKRK